MIGIEDDEIEVINDHKPMNRHMIMQSNTIECLVNEVIDTEYDQVFGQDILKNFLHNNIINVINHPNLYFPYTQVRYNTIAYVNGPSESGKCLTIQSFCKKYEIFYILVNYTKFHPNDIGVIFKEARKHKTSVIILDECIGKYFRNSQDSLIYTKNLLEELENNKQSENLIYLFFTSVTPYAHLDIDGRIFRLLTNVVSVVELQPDVVIKLFEKFNQQCTPLNFKVNKLEFHTMSPFVEIFKFAVSRNIKDFISECFKSKYEQLSNNPEEFNYLIETNDQRLLPNDKEYLIALRKMLDSGFSEILKNNNFKPYFNKV